VQDRGSVIISKGWKKFCLPLPLERKLNIIHVSFSLSEVNVGGFGRTWLLMVKHP
jgi:hypothetical protein